MPAKSEAQRRWAYATKGKAWAEKHHFDNKGKLPPKVKAKNNKAAARRVRAKRREPSA